MEHDPLALGCMGRIIKRIVAHQEQVGSHSLSQRPEFVSLAQSPCSVACPGFDGLIGTESGPDQMGEFLVEVETWDKIGIQRISTQDDPGPVSRKEAVVLA